MGGYCLDIAQAQARAFIGEGPVLSRHPPGGIKAAWWPLDQHLQRGIRADLFQQR